MAAQASEQAAMQVAAPSSDKVEPSERKRRPRPGCGVASMPMRDVVFTPSDAEDMAIYLGAPLEFMPGLAAICKVAYFQQLPKNWSEIRAYSWRTPPPPELAVGVDGMLYLQAASGRLHDMHPVDAFYRVLVKCVLKNCTPTDCPFRKPILRFNVTDDMSGLRKTYYYHFEQHEVVGQVPPAAGPAPSGWRVGLAGCLRDSI
jgi:hypothetical protein